MNRIYADSNLTPDLLEDTFVTSFLEKTANHPAKIFLAMPHIFREDAVQKFEKNYENVRRLARDGVRSETVKALNF